jgi:hypothetical protein
MATILTKKKDSSGIPATADLTNSTGGAELAINTADKRLYTKNSSNVIVEVGVNPATLDVVGNASVGGTLLVEETFTFATANSTGTLLVSGGVSDSDGSLRDVPQSRTVDNSANLATTDLGNFVLAISAGVTMTIPASTFDSGDILSIIARGSSAQISAAIGGMIVAGNASATAVATIADNGVASLIFTSAAGCFVTGNVS